jgi:hypothetical protein
MDWTLRDLDFARIESYFTLQAQLITFAIIEFLFDRVGHGCSWMWKIIAPSKDLTHFGKYRLVVTCWDFTHPHPWLTLLDLSAAFDTIDHSILTHRLENWFGISGLALHWLSSYLTDRSQRVKLDDCLSPNVSIPFGVPQGSVLGPLLFSLYTTPLSNVIEGHSVPHQLYADDTQLYLSFSANESAGSLQSLQSCLDSVQNWMSLNSSSSSILIKLNFSL